MSDLNNPLFENQKEFLERQKQEYKNALLNDVSDLKDQSQKVGKTLLIAGGALAGVWFVSSMFRGKKKIKPVKRKALPPAQALVAPDGGINYQEALNQEPVYPSEYYHQEPAQPSAFGEITRTLLQSDMAKALSQQVTAFLLVFLTKKIEEYLHDSKAGSQAGTHEPVTRDIDFSYHQEDAVKPAD